MAQQHEIESGPPPQAQNEAKPSEPPEPSQSEYRVRVDATHSKPPARGVPDNTPASERPASASERPPRASVRPSAFGLPRPSQRPRSSSPPAAEVGEAAKKPTAAPASLAAPESDPRPSSRPSRAAPSDDEPEEYTSSLLQLALGATSLPSAPQGLLSPSEGEPREPARRTRLSLVAFALMLIAAGVGLARYLRQDAPARAAEAPPRPALALLAEPAPVAAQLAPTAPPPEALRPPSLAERMNEMLTSMPKNADAASDYLFERATRAEREGDTAFAEALLGHAFELDEKNPHPAFAMARIRFAQGNLSGAEGWVARAVQLRPRRAEYRRLYAKILDALGRPRQAQHEERRASELSR